MKESRSPISITNGFDWLPNQSSTRSLGLTVLGARGAGKSFPTFKELCWGDLLSGIPQLILDPVGSSAYLLDQLWRARTTFSEERWWQLVNRVAYLDFGAQEGYVPSWPLLYRNGNESAYEVASRPIDMIGALSPNLESAAIEGMSSVREIGTHAGILLSALGLQLTELESLLTRTKRWNTEWGLFDKAEQQSAEAKKSVAFFRRFSRLKSDIQDRRTKSLLNQTRMLQLDPTMRAMFGSTTPPMWKAWEENGMCIICDFQHIRDLDRRRWCMMAVYDGFLSYKLSCGLRSTPWHVVFEELTQWIPSDAAGESMAAKLDALLNVYGRNYQIYTTTISQELFQLPERLQEVLLAAGNIMIGNQASVEDRKTLAQYFFNYTADGILPKRWDPIYAGEEIIDARPVDWSMNEYMALGSQAFVMPGFHFLVKAAKREGDTSGGLQHMIVKRHIGEWIQDEPVATLRQLIAQRSGQNMQEALAEIDQRIERLGNLQKHPATESEDLKVVSEDTDVREQLLPPDVDRLKGGFRPGHT